MKTISYKTFLAASVLSFLLFNSYALGGEARDQEATAKKLDNMLVAPCCFSHTVANHESGAAYEVKSRIRQMLSEGKSEEEIIQAYVGQYGERILASPRAEGFGLAAYILPVIAILFAASFIMIRGIRKQRPVLIEFRSSVRSDSDYDDRLDEELDQY